jgi:hypothetical protein
LRAIGLNRHCEQKRSNLGPPGGQLVEIASSRKRS